MNYFRQNHVMLLHVPSYCFVLQLIYFSFPIITTMKILVKILYLLVGNCITLVFKKVKLKITLFISLTLILLTWRIWWAPTNANKWRMGFNSAFKGLRKMAGFGTSVFILNNGMLRGKYLYSQYVLLATILLWGLAVTRAGLDGSGNGQMFNRSRLLNNWINPCTNVICEELLVAQTFKKRPALCGIRNSFPSSQVTITGNNSEPNKFSLTLLY